MVVFSLFFLTGFRTKFLGVMLGGNIWHVAMMMFEVKIAER